MCMFKHTHMATKTITIMEDAYKILLMNKMRSESFSEEIRRVLAKKKNIMEFAGAWGDMNDKEAEEMKKNIANFRKGLNKSIARRVKELDLS